MTGLYLTSNFFAKKNAFGNNGDWYIYSRDYIFSAVIDDLSFEILKMLDTYSFHNISICLDLSDSELQLFLDSLVKNSIVSKVKSNYSISEIKTPNNIRKIDTVNLMINNRCNYSCVFCYNLDKIKSSNEFSVEEIYKLSALFEYMGIINVEVSGGEPLLHSSFPDILEIFSKRKFKTVIQTNLSLFKKRFNEIDKFITNSLISVSIDSFSNSKLHNLNSIKEELELLLEHTRNVEIKMTIMPNIVTKEEFLSLYNVLKSMGIKKFNIGSIIPKSNQQHKIYELSKDYLEMLRNIEVDNIDKNRHQYYAPMENNFTSICGVGDYSMAISPEYKISPCSILSNFSIDFPSIDSIPSIWSSKETFNEFRNIDKLFKTCHGCNSLSNCKGGCKAKSYFVNGNLYSVDNWSCGIYTNTI